MTDGEKYKLDFDFIPEESWKFNLRHILSPAARDIVRRGALALFALRRLAAESITKKTVKFTKFGKIFAFPS